MSIHGVHIGGRYNNLVKLVQAALGVALEVSSGAGTVLHAHRAGGTVGTGTVVGATVLCRASVLSRTRVVGWACVMA